MTLDSVDYRKDKQHPFFSFVPMFPLDVLLFTTSVYTGFYATLLRDDLNNNLSSRESLTRTH